MSEQTELQILNKTEAPPIQDAGGGVNDKNQLDVATNAMVIC